jgi:hypothetical protein
MLHIRGGPIACDGGPSDLDDLGALAFVSRSWERRKDPGSGRPSHTLAQVRASGEADLPSSSGTWVAECAGRNPNVMWRGSEGERALVAK